jgi:hypothetical protein
MGQFMRKLNRHLVSEMSGNTLPNSPNSDDRYDKHLDELLEEALEDSFPASDPLSISSTNPSPGPISRMMASVGDVLAPARSGIMRGV